MVTIKRTATTADLVGARRLLSSRLSQLNATSAAAAAKTASSQHKSGMSMPASRRPDQRSTVSIAGSSHSSYARWVPAASTRVTRGGCSTIAAAATDRRTTPKSRRLNQRGKLHCSGGGSGCRCYHGTNSGISNSAGEQSPVPRVKSRASVATPATDDDAPAARSSGLSGATHQRMGKTVSISASHDHTASTRFGQSDITRRSIIKLKPLPGGEHTFDAHNDDRPLKQSGEEHGPTPHQIREQKIFDECRFVPWDPFYKKVVVAPNQDRQFFAAPKSIRGPGSSMLYDIANAKVRHHQDVNIDFTRDAIRRYCPNYSRPSYFRHLC